MIEFDAVSIDFGDVSVLKDVSMTVPDGEFVAVVGPNGAGKTTLLRTCNGLLSPSEGRVRVDGHDVANCSAREIGRLVATVPQETTIAFDFDVENVVAMGRTPHRSRFGTATDDDRTAVESALVRTDTARFADRAIGTLSGGERQRVVFARALAQDTPVLLLDEPTASLDINHQIRTLSLARELADEGRTVIAAIHDLELAARFCDRMALLSDGVLLADGSPAAVLTSEKLEATFDVRSAVSTNPITGTPTVTPLTDEPPGDRRVHVLGSGEEAARTIGRLVEAGIDVTAGVVPPGDVAAVTASYLAREVITAPAFEPVPADRLSAVSELVATADATVIAGPLRGPNRQFARAAETVIALDAAGETTSSDRTVAEEDLTDLFDGTDPVESTTPQ